MTEPRSRPDPNPLAAPSPGAANHGGPDHPGSKPRVDPAGLEHVRSANVAVPTAVGAAVERFRNIYKHLPLTCPNCGFEGRAKIAQLDRTFHCKHCSRVFHVTVQGTVTGMREPEDVHVDQGTAIAPQKLNWVEKRFVQLPRLARWAALAGVLLSLAGMAVWFKKLQPEPLPRDLQKRAELAGRALALGDLHTLDRMTMTDQRETLHKWYEAVRPNEFADLPPESDLTVIVGALGKLLRKAERVAGKQKKVPVADFRTPLEIALPPNDEGMQLVAQVDLVWVKEDGEWRMDGEWLRDSEQRIKFGPPRPFVPAVPAVEAADGEMDDGAAARGRPLTARERKKRFEARTEQAAAQKAAAPEKAPPPPPARRRRGN